MSWYRTDSSFASSQWETALLCNNVSHWPGASLESALWYVVYNWTICHVSKSHKPSRDKTRSTLELIVYIFEILTTKCIRQHHRLTATDTLGSNFQFVFGLRLECSPYSPCYVSSSNSVISLIDKNKICDYRGKLQAKSHLLSCTVVDWSSYMYTLTIHMYVKM